MSYNNPPVTKPPVLRPAYTIAPTSEAEAVRLRTFRSLMGVSAVGIASLLVLLAFMGRQAAGMPVGFLLPALAASLVSLGISEWLNRRGRYVFAVTLFLAALTAMMFVLVYMGNGVAGPAVVLLITIPVTAQLVGGRYGAGWGGVVAVLYIILWVLEVQGVRWQGKMTGMALYGAQIIFFLSALAITTQSVFMFVNQLQLALQTSQARRDELTQANRQAQDAARTAQDAQATTERTVEQLRQAIQQFNSFLQRVSAGDYSPLASVGYNGVVPGWPAQAIPNADDSILQGQGAQDLRALEQQLNQTVATLVTALRDVQAVQQQYARAAWTRYAGGAEARGFRFRAGAVEHDNDAWLDTMAQAVQQKSAASQPQELALPVTLRGEVIGAMAARRTDQSGWTDDDIALAQSVTDQLAQTIEGLRLLDETQRRAAREQLTRRVADQMRRAPDMDSLMQTTLREMRAALGASGGYVHLASSPEAVPHATEAGQ